MLHQIGAGTLGPVFRAYDAETERLVAVKLFRLDLPPERVHQLVDVFERVIASDCAHPSLAAPIATGIVGASAYLAVEYVQAESLDLAVREYGPAPPLDAVRVTAQLAAALDFAAVVDVNHGALHPRDVLLSASETRVTGIGVARALQSVGVTPPVRRPYTAPERLAGAAWDRRADIFSLGALSHELVWGRRITGTGSHVAGTLTPVTGGRLEALQDVFARALADDPADRFATALEFANALADAFNGAGETVESAAPEVLGAEPRLPLAPVDIAASERAVPADFELRATARDRYQDVEVAPPIVPIAAGPLSDALEHDAQPRLEPGRQFVPQPQAETRPQPEIRSQPEPEIRPQPEPRQYAENPPLPERPPDPVAVITPPSSRRSRPMGSIAAALVAGIALGLAGGYFLGRRDLPDMRAAERAAPPSAADATTTPPSTPTSAGQQATEVAVDAPKPEALVPPPSAPARRQADTSTSSAAATTRADRRTPSTPVRPPAPQAPRPAERATSASGTVGRFVGALHVESRPTGAHVYLDGRLIGSTPLSLPTVSAGEHAVRIERDGYRRWSSSVRIVAAEQNRVTASLER